MKHIMTKWTTSIFAEMDIYKSDNTKTTKIINVDDVVKLRYIKDNSVSTVNGRIDSINVEILKSSNAINNTDDPVDTIKNDINILSIVFDCSQEYESIITTIDPKEVIEDAEVTTAIKVTVTPNIKTSITVINANDEGEESTITIDDIMVGTEISPFKFKATNGQIINTTVTVCKFLYDERPEGKISIPAIVVKDNNGKVYTVEFKNIISLNEELPLEDSN